MRNILAEYFLSKFLSQSLLIHILWLFIYFFSKCFLNLCVCVCHSHDFRFSLFVRLVLLPDIPWLLFRIVVKSFLTRCFI